MMNNTATPAFRPIPRPPASAPSPTAKRPVCSTKDPARNASSRAPTRPTTPRQAVAPPQKPRRHPNPAKHTHAISRHAKAGNFPLLHNAVRAARADNYVLNAVNYTMIANAHVEHGRPEDAFTVFADMRDYSIPPTNVTLRVALKAACRMHARRIAADAMQETLLWATDAGTDPCVRTWNMFMQTFVKWAYVDHTYSLLQCMCADALAPSPDVWSFNQAICALGRAGRFHDAVSLAGQLLRRCPHVRPDVVTYNSLLEAAVCHDRSVATPPLYDGEETFVKAIVRSMRRHAVAPNMATETLMLRVLSRKGAHPNTPFVKQCVHAVFSNQALCVGVDKKFLDAAIIAFGMCGSLNDVCTIFDEMRRRTISPDHLTIRALLIGASQLGDVSLARQIVRISNGGGAICDEFAYTSAIAACAHASPCAIEVADDLLLDAARVGTAWTAAMINAAITCYGDDLFRAVTLWKRLMAEGDDGVRAVLSDRMVYDALFRVCGRAGRPDLALRVWYAAKKSNHLLSNSSASRCVFNAFMKGAVENGLEDVVENHMLKKNYMRLLRTECGVQDDYQWPIERIRIKF